MGTGRRFSTNRFTLMTAVKKARLGRPWRACSPAETAIWMGPPMFFRSSCPTAIFHSPTAVSVVTSPVRTTPSLSAVEGIRAHELRRPAPG